MDARTKIEGRVGELLQISKRRMYCDDEQVEFSALSSVLRWMDDDKRDAERIELAAMEAEENEEARRLKKEQSARDLFKGVKINVPARGR